MTDPKPTRKRGREPKPPMLSTNLPAPAFADAAAAAIIAELDLLYELVPRFFSSEASRKLMRNQLIWQLSTRDSLATANIIDMANNGHAPAIDALRIYIGVHLDRGGKWEELLDQVRGWSVRVALQPAVSGYPKGGRLMVDIFVRDLTIIFMMTKALERWSSPLRKIVPQRKIAKFMEIVLSRHGHKLKRQQIELIYRNRNTLTDRMAAFMLQNANP
jgi:hypothetical protein